MIAINNSLFRLFKANLKTILPSVSSRDRAEAIARGLGFKNNTVLKAKLKVLPNDDHFLEGSNQEDAFVEYLAAKHYEGIKPDGYRYFWLELLTSIGEQGQLPSKAITFNHEERQFVFSDTLKAAEEELDFILDQVDQGTLLERDAIVKLIEVCDAHPSFVDGWSHIGILNYKLGEFDKAMEAASAARSLCEDCWYEDYVHDYGYEILWSKLGNRPYLRALHVDLMCNWKQAASSDTFEDLKHYMLLLDPSDPFNICALAAGGAEAGDAISFNQVEGRLEVSGKFERASYRLESIRNRYDLMAVTAYDDEELQKAYLKEVQEVLKYTPNSYHARALLAGYYWDMEFDNEKAIAECQKALDICEEIIPRDFDGRLSYAERENRPYLESLRLMAVLQIDTPKAEECYALLRKYEPKNVNAIHYPTLDDANKRDFLKD